MRSLFVCALTALLLAATTTTALAKDKKPKKPKKGAKTELTLQQPLLQNDGDSVAYIFGLSQSDGLKQYMRAQLNVDSALIEVFAQGILDRINVNTDDPQVHAYTAGQQIGQQIEQMAQSISKDYYAADPDKKMDKHIIAYAIVEGLLGRNEVSADHAMQQFRQIMAEREKYNNEQLWGGNRKAGEEFLAANKLKEGVVTLPSGLQYKVLTQGNGEIPVATSRVKVHYEGHLIDGTEFDSSYKRNQPNTFAANQVIKGWTEALCLMPVGSKWELYIPYNLAYGDRDQGKIHPYSALIFTVELLGIEN